MLETKKKKEREREREKRKKIHLPPENLKYKCGVI
jgi:hypothetical protein